MVKPVWIGSQDTCLRLPKMALSHDGSNRAGYWIDIKAEKATFIKIKAWTLV